MKNLNSIVSSIIANQKKYEKAIKRREKSFESALEWQDRRHLRFLNKINNYKTDSVKSELDAKKNHPSTCFHEHCVWWKRQLAFKEFKASIRKDLKEQKKKKLKDLKINEELLN